MIVYKKGVGGINLLFRIYGSPLPRAFPLALPSALLAIFLDLFAKNEVRGWFLHPLPFGIFASVVGFVLVFRINLSHARYWEARTRVQDMTSRWLGAVAEAIAFDEAAELPSAVSTGPQWRAEFIHLMSLMHGLAMQGLRGDTMLENLVRGSFHVTPFPPPRDPAELPNWQKYNHLCALRHHMNHFRDYWMNLPLPVLGGLSKMEIKVLEKSESKAFCVFMWIHQHLTARRQAGGLNEAAPIVTRIHQNLEDGMNAFEQAMKINDTPFPFPYAQTVTMMLWFQALMCPLMMVAWLNNTWIVVLFTFAAVWSCFTLNEVAREIEEPWKYDPNDIPVAFLHHNFNLSLLAAFEGNKAEEPEKLLEHIKSTNLDDYSLSPSVDYTERGAYAKHAKEALEVAEREKRELKSSKKSMSAPHLSETHERSGGRVGPESEKRAPI
ncbi:hypothetical protein KFL_002380080 [Klebsormidium nitens]|uniref:Uncharacterized protein n=1 Tax=Klebsormidium nitens TaxID=105231 RepID=A0A1Y1I3I3_KLENI|nr:hypothetical protein KFL_002380080 [Klebsormidium nitens]|eukprot:GAQ85495.1 hypothetical protein KFL_002380080 [Klebsormidium nitens]